MRCCKLAKDIFNFYEVIKCENCNHLYKDETIYIGNDMLKVIYLENVCSLFEIDCSHFSFSKKIKQIFNEIIEFNNKIMIVFVNFELEDMFLCIEMLFELEKNVYVINV